MRTRANRGGVALLALTFALLCIGWVAASAGAAEGEGEFQTEPSVAIPGTPMSVYIGQRGQCQSSYLVAGGVDGNFFPGGAPYTFSPVADCGFFLAFPKAGAGQPTALKEQT